ncbi:uncharacterized protein KGF55_004614 [Candida pseudojiufengensis]|uniref:uncharacterized protein n=1 Tax=Candida pseudojiufengensis TaxID=497109 RepID=UPI0022251C3F|nr:uncharacterized protein KGF55_004614 [Candida pseudojiufengensis]KAI5960322.1 hypothetical protein KGF55_004614 [Candida pseudojiufengensis]
MTNHPHQHHHHHHHHHQHQHQIDHSTQHKSHLSSSTIPPRRKTREEILADFENDLIKFESMSIKIDGHDEALIFSRNMEPMPQRLYFILPEYCTYHLSLRYKIKQRPLNKLSYHQTVKKSGIIVDSRDLAMNQCALVNNPYDENDYHEITFIPAGTPGGAFLRGEYPAKSIIKEDGKTIWSYKWTIKIVKKADKPQIGGFD